LNSVVDHLMPNGRTECFLMICDFTIFLLFHDMLDD
jgi:hypothetical protein